MCAKSKPNNRKLGLYIPLPVPSHPWESVSMDLLEDYLSLGKGMTIYMLLRIGSAKCVF